MASDAISAEAVTQTDLTWQPGDEGFTITLTVPAGAVRLVVVYPVS